MSDKKAQAGPIAFVILVIIFLIGLASIGGTLWGLWFGASEAANLTGIEAFVYHNPMLFIFIGLILGIMVWIFWGQ